MPDHDDSTKPPVNIGMKTGSDAGNGEAAGQSATVAENIMPPEQPPMDDAAGGPQAEDGDAPMPGAQPVEGETDPQVPAGAQRAEDADSAAELGGKGVADIGSPHDPTAGRADGHTSEANPG